MQSYQVLIFIAAISCAVCVTSSWFAWRSLSKTRFLLSSQEEMRTTADDVQKLLTRVHRIDGSVGHLMKFSKGQGYSVPKTDPLDKNALRAHFGLALHNSRNHYGLANSSERLRGSSTADGGRAKSHQQNARPHEERATEAEEGGSGNQWSEEEKAFFLHQQ